MEKDKQPNLLVLFIKQCMLFGSKDWLFRFFGAFVWIDLVVIIYAIVKIFHPE